MPIRFQLLGASEIDVGGDRVPIAAERLYQLAVHLASLGDWQPRERLAALLWPQADSAAARRNLRKLLFRAAKLVPGIESRADAIRLLVPSDAREFDAACAQRDWALAVDLYRGVFADGLELNAPEPFSAWSRFERERLAALFRTAAAARLTQLSDAEQRVLLAQRWLALEPFDEDALVWLFEAHVACDRSAEAQRLVRQYSDRLATELGVEASARVRALGTDRQAGGGSELSREQPSADPGFVGRRTELLEVQALIERDACRVLTITGPGGVGKSRLAQVARARLASQFEADHWIALDDLSDVAQVAPRLAAALDITLAGDRDALRQVIDKLGDRRLLLIADNAEHLADFGRLTVELIRNCPRLKLIQTSRSRLSIDGEWLLPLAGLPTPEPDETEIEMLRNFDAVRLFELRAQAAAPAFDCRSNAFEIAELVRRLEGAPLAIELAAAWVRLLPIGEIRREIVESLDLFEASGSTPERQRSVRASFEHSWKLLRAAEQQALAQLSVFAGPFTREAAAQVAQVKLPVLAALVDKSLLRADGEGWFSFHALMQQCAREKLQDVQSLRVRHVDYFARLLGSSSSAGGGEAAEARRIERQFEEYRLAWRFAAEQRNARALATMARPLARYFGARGRFGEGAALMRDTLEVLESSPLPDRRAAARVPMAVLRHALGTLLHRLGELSTAAQALQSAAEVFRDAGESALLRSCEFRLGMTYWARGDPKSAQVHFEETLSRAQQDGDDLGCLQALNGLSLCARRVGDFDRGLTLLEQALVVQRRIGDPLAEANLLHDLSVMMSCQIRLHQLAVLPAVRYTFEDARQPLLRALALCDKHALLSTRTYCLASLANVELDLGHFAAANAYLARAGAGTPEEGLVAAYLRLVYARSALRRGELADAGQELGRAMRLARQSDSAGAQLDILMVCADWLAARGERERAAALFAFIARDRRAEAVERLGAQAQMARLGLTPAESKVAESSAARFELQRCVDELQGELVAADAIGAGRMQSG